MVAITKALAPAVATPVVRPKKGMMETYDGVSGRKLGKAMAAGGKFGLVLGISMYTEGGHCLVLPRSQNRHLLLTRDYPLPGPCGEHLLPPRLPLASPFAARGGAVSGPESRRFIFPGGGLGVHFGVPVLQPGGFGQERGDDIRADSLMLAASGVGTNRPPTPDI